MTQLTKSFSRRTRTTLFHSREAFKRKHIVYTMSFAYSAFNVYNTCSCLADKVV